jgi:hypothetical protein
MVGRATRRRVVVPRTGEVTVEIPLARWTNLPADGWHAGNTHVHYDEHEQRPGERLRLDPRVEDLSVIAVSHALRRELAYATNRFPVGFARDRSSLAHAVDVGEETRHNTAWKEIGYGHVMLLGIERLVEPLSRGLLVDDDAPDYPPLVDACDEAHRQGGVAIWCHNGNGMEAPVAAALGKLDAFNLFDPYWRDPEWDIWYALLNCGLRLPASTGSDWFICSSNRVYAHTGVGSEAEDDDHEHAPADTAGGARHTSHDPADRETAAAIRYRRWLGALAAGRSFITNGPALFLAVEGRPPGQSLDGAGGGASLEVEVRWRAAQPLHRVELVRNGRVVERATWDEGRTDGVLRWRIGPGGAGGAGEWVAARCFGRGRTSYGHFLWAHTSPFYLGPPDTTPRAGLGAVSRLGGRPSTPEAREAARFFTGRLDRALEWVGSRGRYREPAHRERLVALYREARELYGAIAG